MIRNSVRFFCAFLVAMAAIGVEGVLAATRNAAPVVPSREFEFTYVVRVPATRGRELRLWVPIAHSGRYQTISRLHIEAPASYRIVRYGQGNEDAYFVLRGSQLRKPTEISIRFAVFRRERTTRLPSTDPTPIHVKDNPALAFYLRPDRMIPLGGIIGRISTETTHGISDPLKQARRIYEYVISHMRYDKSGTGWGRGDADWACSSHRGNCTDFHSLFIGMARAAGIPARFHIGFPLPENEHRGEIPGYHCWADFYVNTVGWVPIDASQAWLDPSRHNFYFGNLDPDRVMFTMGRDLHLGPPQHGQPLNFFIYPYAELDGKPFSGLQHQFFFRDLSD